MSTAVDIKKAIKSVGVPEKLVKTGLQQFPEAASVDDTWRQGDIYITLMDRKTLDEHVKAGRYVKSNTVQLQLAEGDTQGSRHCLRHDRGVTMYTPVRDKMTDDIALFAGPIIILDDKCDDMVVDHPEHAPVSLPGGRVYEIGFQKTITRANELRRVVD